ncbi:MAG: hypothetical protein ACI9MR_002618 [Myxococcota bacterium]|jgi:hypothetical protein
MACYGDLTLPLGSACPVDDQYCAPGMRCHDDICRAFCCQASDCPAGWTCENVEGSLGTLGACVP